MYVSFSYHLRCLAGSRLESAGIVKLEEGHHRQDIVSTAACNPK